MTSNLLKAENLYRDVGGYLVVLGL